MRPIDFENLDSVVQAGRVHANLYRDPDIFELEMERIFGGTWVYVAHESQIPDGGDFITTHVGRKPVIVVRDQDSAEVHVLYNRCGHRGAVVCNLPSGNARRFRCGYHGWVFDSAGRLVSVPLKEGYYDGVDLGDPRYGLVNLPRVASYRGFIFACARQDVEDLETHLGPVKNSIDDLVARSPVGSIRVTGGVHKYLFKGNWKLQIENVIDGYHPSFSHVSTLDERGRQFRRRGEEKEGPAIGRAGSDDPNEAIAQMDVSSYAQGHSISGALPERGDKSGPAYQEYLNLMRQAYGQERAEEILGKDWHNTLVYPNLCLQMLAQHVRVIKPVAVDRTEVWVYPITLDGVPEQLNHDVIKYLNITHSAASLIQTDDLEQFKRIQVGLGGDGAEWVSFERGLFRDPVPSEDQAAHAIGSSELPMRAQWQAWRTLMTGEQRA